MGLVFAIPKGALQAKALQLLARAGISFTPDSASRQLLSHSGDHALLELRNHDVPVYVDYGAADLGVVGYDVLKESGRDLYQPLDLGFGRCRLCLISLPGVAVLRRVATKYPRTTREYLAAKHVAAEVIPLWGNVELAAVTRLADAVVDLVDTGRTARANGLEIVEVILESTARLVVNRVAMKTKAQEIRALLGVLRQALLT